MALHYETQTRNGEPIKITIVRNTFIARVMVDGADTDAAAWWFVKEHGNNGIAFPIVEEIAAASELTISHAVEAGPDGVDVENIELDFLQSGQSALNYCIAFERDTGWGRVYGPIIGRVAKANARPWWLQAARNALRP